MASQTYGAVGNSASKPWNSATSLDNAETTPLVTKLPSGKDESNTVPENTEKHNIWSRLIFKWFTPILHRGNEKKKLDREDLDLVPLPSDCSTENVTEIFERYWKKQLERNPSNPSLFITICHAFGREFMYAGFLKLIHDLCVFVGPQILRRMILYLRDNESSLAHGLLLSSIITCSQLMMSICLRHYFFKCYITGLRIRTSMITSIYSVSCLLQNNSMN
jgi:ATP-binding cassette, subfamily C (CFTR/MRP), member 1